MAQNGLRQGEAFNLIWDDIDFESRTIRIGFRRTFQPKTSTSNRLVFPSESLLADLSKLHGVRRSDTLVFPSTKDCTKLRTGIKKMLATASRWAGLRQPATSQMLRQFFATHQAEAGVPEHVLQRDLGHAVGSQVTKKYYIRADDAVRRSRYDLQCCIAYWVQMLPRTGYRYFWAISVCVLLHTRAKRELHNGARSLVPLVP